MIPAAVIAAALIVVICAALLAGPQRLIDLAAMVPVWLLTRPWHDTDNWMVPWPPKPTDNHEEAGL